MQVHIRKVKLLKSPKFDLGALLNLHGESTTDEQGQKVSRGPTYMPLIFTGFLLMLWMQVEREFKETVLESV